MDRVHAVQPGWTGWPDDDTVVCRCEEVTVGRLRAAIDLGADDVRSVKLLARPGMGWCQGRICGQAVAALTAQHRRYRGHAGSAEHDDARHDAERAVSRPLAQPVPLRVLAELARDDDDDAVSLD
jgi:NAD(P)H-nitrite reductase large subunit